MKRKVYAQLTLFASVVKWTVYAAIVGQEPPGCGGRSRGVAPDEIIASWRDGPARFPEKRRKYLLY